MAPCQSQRVRLFGGIQACADSSLFAPASNQSGARCAQTHNGGWARTNSGWYTKLSGCCVFAVSAGCWEDAPVMQTCATSRLQMSVIVLCGRLVRRRAGPAHTSHCAGAKHPQFVFCCCCCRVRECSRERERKKLLLKLNLYAAIEH